MLSMTTAILGHALTLSGDLKRAVGLLEEAVQSDMQRMSPQGFAFPWVWLGECYLGLGRDADAEVAARKAHDIATRHREEGHLAWAHRLLGLIESTRTGGKEMAIEHFTAAKSVASANFMAPLVSECEQQLKAAASGC